ncbi:MAG TPA: CheR family methyltransferase [Kofleriaceae bacterium]|jgi:chemotaxis protein methyltransferase CheR|nr:CheR family methyltransferase [Kofleriaceae bacterium]
MTAQIARFRAVIAQRLGLQLGEAGHATLVDVLARRIAATALDPEDYLDELARARLDGELGAVAEAVTIGETFLFRGADQLRALTDVALPALARGRPVGQPIQILSAGCASGEEPYSIAIAVREAAAWPVAIRAVDANRASLAQARRARYRAWALRETPAEIQRRYFRPAGRDLVLDEAVRGAVAFEHRNLVDDPALWAPASHDVVFCRNVIMYFSPEVQRALVERIAGSLRPGGFLFLGHAETLRELSRRFELGESHGAFYYRLRGDAGQPAIAPSGVAIEPPAPIAAAAVAGTVPVAVVDGAGGWVEAIRSAAERIVALTASRAATPPAVAARADDLAGVVELVRRERFGEALAVIDALPAEASDDPDVLLLHAVLLAHGGRLAAAQDASRRLLAIAWCGPRGPRVAGAHYVLALCCEAAGDRRGAEDHGQTAAYLDPTFAMPRLHLGLAARRVGDHAAARRELGHALVLLHRESASRLLLFGGGFDREALIALCRAELAACGAAR